MSEEEAESEMEEDKSKDSGAGESAMEEDYSKVKLSTKHAAFIRQKADGKWYLNFATQNQRSQLSVPKQKLEVPTPFVDGIKHIISSYPNYCDFEDIPGFDEGSDFAKFLGELANLQILVVQ